MSDDNKDSNVKGVIDATTGLVKAVPIYDDLIQPAAKELGKTLNLIAKSVNLVLTPLSGVVWGFEKIKEFVEKDVPEKLKNIPTENIVTPSRSVVGPALEALKYTGNESELRNLYANLVANALDFNTKKDVHPSFVEIIRQINPFEAKLLLFLSKLKNYPIVCHGKNNETIRGGLLSFSHGYKSNLIKEPFSKVCSDFKESLNLLSTLDNYKRLQLVEVQTHTTQKLKDAWAGQGSDNISSSLELEITYNETLLFTDFGTSFIESCVKNKI